MQTRTCESAGRDDDVWPVLPDHKTCLGHAGVHGRRVRAPSWPSSPSLRHVSAGHSNDAEEATDTSRSARASRRDVVGQPEPPEALDNSVGAAGTPAAHPLRRESAASYFEEAQLFRTRARVWYVLILNDPRCQLSTPAKFGAAARPSAQSPLQVEAGRDAVLRLQRHR